MPTTAQKHEVQDKVTQLVAQRFDGDYAKAFDHYDSKPKDGKISAIELMQLLKDAGIGNWLTRDAWVDGIIAELDADHDGTISAEEFKAVIRSLKVV